MHVGFLECIRIRINELQTYHSGSEFIETLWHRIRQNKNDEDRQVFFYVEALARWIQKAYGPVLKNVWKQLVILVLQRKIIDT